jgi:hypothetical protein
MELAALIIAILALGLGAMALPTVFQMFWGRPDIRAEFVETIDEHGKRLTCYLVNRPVGVFLSKLGVRRDAGSVFADFVVREVGNDRVAVDTTRALIRDVSAWEAGEGALRAAVHSPFPVGFPILFHRFGHEAVVIDLLHNTRVTIAPGRYCVAVAVSEGNTLREFRHEFSVGVTTEQTYWLPN